MKLWARFAAVVTGILLLVAVAAVWVAQSDWLRAKVHSGIIEQAEKATGGKVELGAFRFDWRTLTAEVDRFVIHGTESASDAPLLAIDRITVGLRVISLIGRDVNVSRVEAEHPQAHVILYPDGRTNLPQPKTRRTGKPIAETILDLKIGKFDLRDGTFFVESPGQPPRRMPWEAHGNNLAAQMSYDPASRRYSGNLSLAPLRVESVDFDVAAAAAMEPKRITISNATVRTKESQIDLKDVVVDNFADPVASGRYDARVSLDETASIFRLRTRQSGTVYVSGAARYRTPGEYAVDGALHGEDITYWKLRDMRVTSDVHATPDRIHLSSLHVKALGGEVLADADVVDFRHVTARGRAERFDLRKTAAIQTKKPLPYDGMVSGPFDATIDADRIRVNAHLNVAPAPNGPAARGEVAVRYDSGRKTVELGQSWVDLPNSRIEASGTLGDRLNVKADSRDFNDLLPAVDALIPGKPVALSFASASFNGTVTGPLAGPRIDGRAAARNLRYEQQNFDELSGDITLSENSVRASNARVVYGGIRAEGGGAIALQEWRISPASTIAADVALDNAELTRLFVAAGHKEVPFTGTLSAKGQITGAIGAPQANGDITLTKGTIYSQPFDSISGRVQSVTSKTQSLTGLFVSGPKRVNITARFEHAGTRFPAGQLDFNLTSNTMPLNQIALVRARQPDIHGFGKFHADGSLRISHNAKHELQFSLLNLNADASANSLELEGRNLGDARFTAQTKEGVVQARFDSNAANAAIHGEGTVRLDGDYPVKGKLTFANAGLNSLAALILKEDDSRSLNFDGTAEGNVTITGSASKPDQLTADLNVPHLEIRPLPGTDFAKSLPNYVLTNAAPIRVAYAGRQLRLENVHLRGPDTDLSVNGAIAMSDQTPLSLQVQGSLDLNLARSLSLDLTSSGTLTLNATVRGGWQTPDVSGQAVLRNGDFHYADFSNGLTNATGQIVFNGTRATIQSFSGESGGGKVDASGFVSLTKGLLAFRIETRAQEVRVRYPEGVSSVSDAALTLAGTSERSQISGRVTVRRIALNPKSDAATILAATAQPVETPSVKTGPIANMNLDISVETAPDVALQTSVAQSIQADAKLTLRGTVTNPAVLGRINITQGELVFFGNKYTINQGSVSFFNPTKIDPIVNFDLETKARGVDVILTVSGPMTKLNLSYRSDPPLQFSDIVALLATGRTPIDPTLGLRDTGQSQGFQQLGASALLGQAIANPVAGRLQRFFGVSRIKIDPQLTGITGSPEARLTIEQQVNPEILFTYITDVSSTSTQLIRVEWALNRHWSAILIREENGYVGLDFAYKKHFR